ncbi:MAG: hypothetical protein OXN90_10625 [Gemmatimonadota bacterium]|nr:hypothetical protein [Gemmatimonadota bacterium]
MKKGSLRDGCAWVCLVGFLAAVVWGVSAWRSGDLLGLALAIFAILLALSILSGMDEK